MKKDKTKKDEINLTKSLNELENIVDWFESQEDVDVETGLEKVREAAKLIKESKGRLSEIENEFREIEKEIGSEGKKERDDEDWDEEDKKSDNHDSKGIDLPF